MKFNSKKNSVIIVLAVLIAVRLVIVLVEYQKRNHSIAEEHSEATATAPLNPDVNISKSPDAAVTALNSTAQNEVCQGMRAHYHDLDEVKKIEKTSVRFVNVHKKVDGIVYRMRFFYKDSSERETPTYLLYKEDHNEEESLIEKSPYKKGVQYAKIEKANGPIIYTEEGVNIGADQDLFLHYENKELKDLQGVSPLRAEKDFIECRF